MNEKLDEKVRYSWDDRKEKMDGMPIIGHLKRKDSTAFDFISNMLAENLNHARHVENERVQYHTIFIAFYIGALAWYVDTLTNSETAQSNLLRFIIFCGLAVFSLISWTLNERWSNAFDRHMSYAKGCYYLLHKYYVTLKQ